MNITFLEGQKKILPSTPLDKQVEYTRSKNVPKKVNFSILCISKEGNIPLANTIWKWLIGLQSRLLSFLLNHKLVDDFLWAPYHHTIHHKASIAPLLRPTHLSRTSSSPWFPHTSFFINIKEYFMPQAQKKYNRPTKWKVSLHDLLEKCFLDMKNLISLSPGTSTSTFWPPQKKSKMYASKIWNVALLQVYLKWEVQWISITRMDRSYQVGIVLFSFLYLSNYLISFNNTHTIFKELYKKNLLWRMSFEDTKYTHCNL